MKKRKMAPLSSSDFSTHYTLFSINTLACVFDLAVFLKLLQKTENKHGMSIETLLFIKKPKTSMGCL